MSCGEEEGARKSLLRRGLAVPPSHPGVPRLSLGNAGHPRHTRPPGSAVALGWPPAAAEIRRAGRSILLLLGATEI